jgi:hypothetical protein
LFTISIHFIKVENHCDTFTQLNGLDCYEGQNLVNCKENVLHKDYEGQKLVSCKENVLHKGYEGQKLVNFKENVLHKDSEGQY